MRKSGLSYCWWLVFCAVLAMSGCSSPPPVSVVLTPSSPQAVDQGADSSVAINAMLTNDGSAKGVRWTLSGPGSLTSTTSATSYLPPTTPTLTGPQQAMVTATSIANPSKSATVQITVNPYPVIPFQSLANGTVGVAYSQPVVLTGGTAPFQWSVYDGPVFAGSVAGSLPDGMSVDSTGTISGTPTSAGTWYFDMKALDVDNAFGFNVLSIQVNPASGASGNPVPFLNQPLVPAAVSPGGSALTLSVSGAGFLSSATVDFNGVPLKTTFVDSEHLTAIVPAADIATAKTASVTVANPAPGGGSSNVAFFQVGAPQTTVRFAAAANSPLQTPEPFGLAIGDFNQDGKPDLAVAGNVRLYVMLSNGDGTFAPASGSPVSIPSPPNDDLASPFVGPVAVGDFNHSGHTGLAVGEINNEAAVILLGNGNGTFSPSSSTFAITQGSPMSAIAAADFNADGNLDLALISSTSGVSQVDLGYGDGAFSSAGTLYRDSAGFPAGVAVGDFNGDGKLDAAIANGGSVKYPYSGVSVSLGNGDGTFLQANRSPIPLGESLSAIVTGDFNGDGKLDLAVTDYGGNTVGVLLGNGDGTFKAPTTVTVGDKPEAMVVGDFNNDGKLDIATANSGDGTVTLLLGNGDGTFTQSSGSPYPVAQNPDAIVAADFNGDGKLDLAVATLEGTGSVTILLQQ